MKIKFAYLACICLTTIISCKKETIPQTPPDTSLEITVSDELGNRVAGASVALLDDEELTPMGESQTTDVNGIVTFKNLEARKYAWAAVKGCKNNANGSGISVSPLTANIKNTVNTVISGTGTISLYNNSTNPYHVYLNGELIISSMLGGTTQELQFKPTGSYTIRILQVSGYVFEPTDITYTGNLACGGTLISTFPN